MQGSQIVDYRNFRFSKLNTPEFKHLKYLAYWPVFSNRGTAVDQGEILPYILPIG